MFANIIWIVAFAGLASLFGWLVWRAWGASNRIVKWVGAAAAAFGTLILALVTVVVVLGFIKVYAPRGNPVIKVTVAWMQAQIKRVAHLTSTICAACHTLNDELPLSGGKNILADIPMPLGDMSPPNLTPGGSLAEWTDGEVLRVIREGTNRDGHLSPVMAAMSFSKVSDQDAQSIVAYLRSQPSVENPAPKRSMTPLALAFITLGMFPINPLPEPGPVASVPVGPTLEYGRYIANFIGCSECHGEDMSGGAGGLAPRGPTLRTVKVWSVEQFIETLRTEVNPTGRVLDLDEMPWKFIGRLDDEELAGLHAYLVSFP